MTFFQVDRTQFPIGQGGFHGAVVHKSRDHRLSMVVDCGGSTAAHRRLLIKAFSHNGRQHDFLAISHFDEDHINGIDDLDAAGITFDTVFLPHVQVENYLLWMTLKLAASEASSTEIARIVQIGGRLYGGDYGPVVQVGPPDLLPDLLPDSDSRSGLPPNQNLSDMLSADARNAIHKTRGQKNRVFSCSQSISLKDIDWLIRFYSREWAYPDEVKAIWDLPPFANLKDVVERSAQAMTLSEWKSFAADLSAALSEPIKASDAVKVSALLKSNTKKFDTRSKPMQTLLKDIRASSSGLSCKALLSRLYELSESLKDYNDASMCVYSGPVQRGTETSRELFIRSITLGNRAFRAPPAPNCHTRNVGWLSTGDADFSEPEKLKAFLDHYHSEISLVSVLVLPHHGSQMSYDSNMDRLRELITYLSDRPLFIAPANPEHKKYHHPHWPVESTCRKLGDFYIVDHDLASFYVESIRTVRSLKGVFLLD